MLADAGEPEDETDESRAGHTEAEDAGEPFGGGRLGFRGATEPGEDSGWPALLREQQADPVTGQGGDDEVKH